MFHTVVSYCLTTFRGTALAITSSMTKTTKLGRAERAVYELIQTNAHTPAVIKALYRREVLTLIRAGLLTPTTDGAFDPLPPRADRPASVPPPAQSVAPPPPPKPALVNLNTRISVEIKKALEDLARDAGVDVSTIVRPALEDAVRRLLDERTTPRAASKSGTRRIAPTTPDNTNSEAHGPAERDGTRG